MNPEKKLEEIESKADLHLGSESCDAQLWITCEDFVWLVSEVKELHRLSNLMGSGWALVEYEKLEREKEELQTANGQLTADLMGCRDGVLVRDLRQDKSYLYRQKRDALEAMEEYKLESLGLKSQINKLEADLGKMREALEETRYLINRHFPGWLKTTFTMIDKALAAKEGGHGG